MCWYYNKYLLYECRNLDWRIWNFGPEWNFLTFTSHWFCVWPEESAAGFCKHPQVQNSYNENLRTKSNLIFFTFKSRCDLPLRICGRLEMRCRAQRLLGGGVCGGWLFVVLFAPWFFRSARGSARLLSRPLLSDMLWNASVMRGVLSHRVKRRWRA